MQRAAPSALAALLVLLGSTLLVSPARADPEEYLSRELLRYLKNATVFLKVDQGQTSSRGTGFVVAGRGKTAFVVTNNHVLGPQQPGVAPRITAVFDSGLPQERWLTARVAAADPRRDLAVLEVGGLDQVPQPIEVRTEPELMETMAVFILGFPLGEMLASGSRCPAVTVGKGSISSLRLDERGKLAVVQIDGDVTQGNSGGPVVDSRGRLVGIASATVRNRRIGLAIPASTLNALLQGQLLDCVLSSHRSSSGSCEVRIELGVFDPLSRLRSVAFYQVMGTGSVGRNLAQVPGVNKITLQREGRVAVGNFVVEAPAGDRLGFTMQAVCTNVRGETLMSAPQVHYLKLPASKAAPVDLPPRSPQPATLEEPALRSLLEDLRSTDLDRRQHAVERLGGVDPGPHRDEVVRLLAPLLEDKSLFVRTAATRAYLAWAGKEGVPTLYRTLERVDCFITQSIILEELARLDGPQAAKTLACYLPRLTTRAAARKALQHLGPQAEPALLPYLDSEHWEVRKEVCTLLKGQGTARSLPQLARAEKDSNSQVAEEARLAVAAIKARGGRK